MPCLLAILALFSPRLVLFLIWLFSDLLFGPGYLSAAFDNFLVPFLGFLFLPLTTLAWAFTLHSGIAAPNALGIIILVVAVLIDLGLVGLGGRGARG